MVFVGGKLETSHCTRKYYAPTCLTHHDKYSDPSLKETISVGSQKRMESTYSSYIRNYEQNII